MLINKKLQDAQGVCLYALLDFQEHSQDVEKSSLDLIVTDGANCWQLKGRKRTEKEMHLAVMTRLRDAFTQPESPEFTWRFTSTPEKLTIRCQFQAKELDDNMYSARLELLSSEDSQRAVSGILDALFLNLTTLQEANQTMVKQCKASLQEAAASRAHVQQFLDTNQKREEDLYVKFSAILNEKKAKAAEWKQRAEEAEARLQAEDHTPSGSQAGSEADSQATEPSDDEDAEAADVTQTARPDAQEEDDRFPSSIDAVPEPHGEDEPAPMDETSDAHEGGDQTSYLDMPTQPIEEEPDGTGAVEEDPRVEATESKQQAPAAASAQPRPRVTVRRKRR